MRQTPFGVWNKAGDSGGRRDDSRSNEADAFRRLEYDCVPRAISIVTKLQ